MTKQIKASIVITIILICGLCIGIYNSINYVNYPCLYFNDKKYIITGETIAEDRLRNEIGEVTNKIELYEMPDSNGESNILDVGSKIYEFEPKFTNPAAHAIADELAVERHDEYEDGRPRRFYKATEILDIP